MSVKTKLLTASSLYLLGRLTSDLTGKDMRRWATLATGLTPDDFKGFANAKLEDVLESIGLERRRSFGDEASLFLSGMLTGAVLGATITALMTPATGQELRKLLLDRITKAEDSATAESGESASGNGARQERPAEVNPS